MTSRPDDRERWRALTDLDATLLVEASAGTGKTSLLAGRVVMLLAAGRLPSSIAAITFTERAAGELRERVDKFASMLINGMVPKDLAPAFSEQPLRDDPIEALRNARPQLGDLTASTIHSFCLEILQSYAVEARVDPGAVVMDAEQTDLAFKSIFDNWLGTRLGLASRPDDPIVVMAADDPKLAVKTLTALARFRRSYPEARPLTPAAYGGLVHELFDAIAEFRRWISRVPAPDEAFEDVTAFEALANAISDARSDGLPFSQLWSLVQVKSPTLSRRDGHKLARYKLRQNHWDRSAGKSEGPLLTEEGRQHYERCARLFGDCMATIADTLLAGFFGETDGLLKAFETFKRDAAVLDFDDILMRTRDLLRSNEKVREDVAKRYRHILVDEYQDTDPVQTEILFLITSETGSAVAWEERIMRPGALFMVGDPKQAIYRFRGADLKTYLRARAAVETQFQGNVLQIKANFRSGKSILEHVDQVFAERLTMQQGGYVTLAATVAEDLDRIQSVARLSYDVAPNAYADTIRDVEAKAVAELCGRLIGNVMVRRSSGKIALAEPGDIALLAPRRTGLWLYERALEELAIPVASQAGKNLYRRQETQDFVALVRALADSRDTLALGAVLRGPLVGLTEKDLLDIATALKQHDEKAFLDLNTDLSLVHHPVAREVLTILQDLWRKRRSTTPHAILSEAIERLRAMPSIASRSDEERARSLGNIGALLEQTRSYHVRGFKQLAIDLAGDWDAGAPTDEAPSDAQRNSIDIVTVHKAKGLEWPVVIPINFVTMPDDANDFFHRSADNSVHWTLGDIISSSLDETVAADRAEAAQEHERLLYVACTRALDLLVLPAPGWSPLGGWAKFLDLGQASLAEIRHPTSKPRNIRSPLTTNSQTSQLFAEESEHIEVSNPRIRWHRPSIDDVDRELIDRAGIDTSESGIQSTPDALVEGAGALRGIILHKLVEELLTQVVEPDPNHLEGRAQVLAGQLITADAGRPAPAEMAATAMRTFTLPGLKPYIANMVPEIPLYGVRSETLLVSARADAIAFDAGVAVAAFDWKSDIAPSPADRQAYAGQLLEYLELLALDRGAIVFMTSGEIQWVNRKRTTSGSE